MSVILVSVRTLGCSKDRVFASVQIEGKSGREAYALDLKPVRGDDIREMQEVPVHGDNIRRDVKLPGVTHDRCKA